MCRRRLVKAKRGIYSRHFPSRYAWLKTRMFTQYFIHLIYQLLIHYNYQGLVSNTIDQDGGPDASFKQPCNSHSDMISRSSSALPLLLSGRADCRQLQSNECIQYTDP